MLFTKCPSNIKTYLYKCKLILKNCFKKVNNIYYFIIST